jgi:hypothetical protein
MLLLLFYWEHNMKGSLRLFLGIFITLGAIGSIGSMELEVQGLVPALWLVVGSGCLFSSILVQLENK